MTERTVFLRLPALLLGCLLAAGAAGADGELQFADLGECRLENGERILDCRLAYRTLGMLNEDRSNVLVFPTWYTGSTANLIDFGYIGAGKIADTDHYHVVTIEAFGNGVSSSPSNNSAQPGAGFPAFSIGDMVAAQHRLLTEQLGLQHVFAVVGASMGGMQAYEWAVQHPEFMDKVVAIEGTPWPTSYDLLLWTAWLDAEAVYDGSEASLRASSMLLGKLDGLTLWSPEHFNSMVSVEEYPGFTQGFIPQLNEGQLYDRHSQTRAAVAHDVRRHHPGFQQSAADLIKARLLSVVFSRDHMVNAGPSIELGKMIDASTLVLDSPCGHMTPNPECLQSEVAAAVHAFLTD